MDNEISRMQQLAGINEIKITKPNNVIDFVKANNQKILNTVNKLHGSFDFGGGVEIDGEDSPCFYSTDNDYYISFSFTPDSFHDADSPDDIQDININGKKLYYCIYHF